MDVLKPPLIWVDGRCYRVNDPDSECYGTSQSGVDWDDSPSNYGNECTLEEPCDQDEDDYEITMTDGGRYKTVFHVARVYFAPIIGAKGQTKKRLEDETKTIIKVPRQANDNDVGASRKAVVSARRRIEMIVDSCRRKQQFTHFLSMPMVSPTVKEAFIEFKELVLRDCKSRGVDESIFQNPDKLHLTLCPMVLQDNVERSRAAAVLEDCKKAVIDPIMEGHSITILLSGINFMNDDPSEVDVLYATVHANEILQELVDSIVDYCSQAGILEKKHDNVKLHVTVMNTLFRNSKTENYGNQKKRETFNGRPILERFRDFEFGEITIDTVHLSTRHTTSKTDGYYQSTTSVSLLL